MNKAPMPRVDKKRKLVCVFSTQLRMFEVRMITNKGMVSKKFDPQTAFTDDVHIAFRRFSVPFAGFKSVPRVDKAKCKSWNEYIETVWRMAN